MATEINEVEPVAEFVQKIGSRVAHGLVQVNLVESGYLLEGRVVVDKIQLDLFAAQLAALGDARPDLAYLFRDFLESFPAVDAGRFSGETD